MIKLLLGAPLEMSISDLLNQLKSNAQLNK
jgi:hypothetical protein